MARRQEGEMRMAMIDERESLATAEHTTPLGDVRMVVRGATLCALAFVDRWERVGVTVARRWPGVPVLARATEGTARVAAVLDRYFAGDVLAPAGVATDGGGTPFQQRVWAALQRIPAGTTTSYAALAAAIRQPDAVRAVGAANGANPIWLFVPCHRAIGADGRLVGYAGGVDRKRWLLAHEARWAGLRAMTASASR